MPPTRPRSSSFPIQALAILVALAALGWFSIDRPQEEPEPQAELSGRQYRLDMPMCAGDRDTCIVDGDTIWLEGRNLRLRSFDTPEPHSEICGGQTEVDLARRASGRLRQLLSENVFDVETSGTDGTGERTLATVSIGGRDVGDIFIEEGLARSWPDGDEWWCR